ncbi:DNA-binding transcriptional regulator, LysR family [Nannocystis exedens]|uniref:DNA-binding transcriptional regulator, LysR family n=1 Tax=Nannocystis exedens TaxID=54 RepID=A0A1I2I7R9_9BACT|nr:LysR substrate-binding domain-containing protein [Nannocystis exedens]PCC73548.1 transcriptional regulator [Nannocystis exedens]SFF37693.1 DNA-binding transcriptional regulator, LysR family [Nannocystis exedens]
MNIAALDLNLLLVLHTVLVERSAAAAARRLHVTPSAVSNSLAKLRAQLGDPLVVRSGRGLVPTPRALELAPHLRAAVRELERVVAGAEEFDPATTTRSFALALSDAHQVCDLPRVARAFAAAMPRAQLRIVSIDHFEAAGGLAGGEVDAAIAPATAPQPGQHAHHLYEEAGVLLVRRDHPAAGRPVTREVWASLRHVDIHLALGRGGIGHRAARAWLAGERLAFDVAVVVPSFVAAAVVAANSDYVCGLPRRVAEALAPALPLTPLMVPGPPMAFSIDLVWHDRTHLDAGARAFRELVSAALASPRPANKRGPRRRA